MSNTTNILPHVRFFPAASVGIVLFCSLSIASTFFAAFGQAPKPKADKSSPAKASSTVVDQKTFKHLELGRKLYESQHYERCIPCFDSAIRCSPDIGVAYFYRGAAKLAIGREEEALLDLNRAIALNQDDFDAYLHRAKLYAVLSDYGKALSDLKECKRLNPKNAEVYSELGKLCAEKKDWQGAIENFTKQSTLASRPREGLLRRAAAFSALGRDREAANDYLLILKLYPTDRECIERLMTCFERLGKVDESLKISESLLLKTPNDRHIRMQRAKVLFKAEKYEKAVADLDFLIKQITIDDEALQLRAECFIKLQKFEKAVADLSVCIKLDGGDSSTQYLLRSKAYRQLGKIGLANSDLEKANLLNRK
jgi:tetratricopeptide (TPR) repeat protein